MLKWDLMFFFVALVAALLGFGGIAGEASGIAQIIFYAVVVVFGISIVMHKSDDSERER